MLKLSKASKPVNQQAALDFQKRFTIEVNKIIRGTPPYQ